MTPEKDAWADALACEFIDLALEARRDMATRIISAQLCTLKAQAQADAISAATEEMKKVFLEFGIGGGNK